jgi:multiple sugar transport system permease protein
MSITQLLTRRPDVRKPWLSRTRRRTIGFYAFIAPWLIGLVFLGIVPLVLGFLTSLTNYDGLNLASIKFLGMGNYAQTLADSEARYALGRTLIWTGLNTPTWIVLSFVLALVLHQNIRGRGFFRTLYYLPTVMPVVALVWIWKIFLDKNYGLLNGLISMFRPGTALPWLTRYAMVGLTAIGVWSGLGWGMIVFLAGLQDIPDELTEAARIDGANSWQAFRYVTIPLMTPIIFFVLINGLISAFQQLVLPMLLTQTGPAHDAATSVPRIVYLYMIHTYRQMFGFQKFGYGMALLWVMIVVIVALTLLLFRTQRYWVHYSVEVEEGGNR